MKKSIAAIAILGSAAMAASASASLLIADGFDYSAGALAGPANAGNSNTDFTPNPAQWFLTGGSATGPTVVTGSLTYPGTGALPNLPGSNSVQTSLSTGTDRMQLATPVANGLFSDALTPSTSLYYSFTMQVASIGSLASTAAGSFIAGFNNGNGSSTGAISTGAGVLCIRKDASNSTTFHLGIGQNQAGGRTYDSTDSYAPGDTIFVVGQYNFGTGSGTDTANLYVYDGATLAAIPVTQPGTATVTSAWDADIAGSIQSFFLRDNATAAATTIDDVRVGTTWADVTSVPEPASLSLLGLGAIAGMARRRRTA